MAKKAAKPAKKSSVKVKDVEAKKNPKGGAARMR
jgi:hypothetical protein